MGANSFATLSNLCNLPPWEIASLEFNRFPKALHIQGVRATHHHFFDRLNRLDSWRERAQCYEDYIEVAFCLTQWRNENDPSGKLSLKNSYLRFLRGWLFDADSAEGAVMKGWVESRMGIAPTYHHGLISDKKSDGYLSYLTERMNAMARTNAIFSQLDLLYEFIQYELSRRDSECSHLTLYRGVYNLEEHDILERLNGNHMIIRLNNLNSFTHDFERAFEFGTKILEARVPIPKIFFDGSFLHASILQGEEEVLVIGGEYEVKLRYY